MNWSSCCLLINGYTLNNYKPWSWNFEIDDFKGGYFELNSSNFRYYSSNCRHLISDDPSSLFKQYAKYNSQTKLYECTICQKTSSYKCSMIKHVENKHFPNSFVYSCQFCLMEFKTKNSINKHLSLVHRNRKFYTEWQSRYILWHLVPTTVMQPFRLKYIFWKICSLSVSESLVFV